MFKRKSVKEQIDKALSDARIKWEKEKNVEFLKYRSVWDKGKEDEKKLIVAECFKKLEEKEKIIRRQEKIILAQKKSFRKFIIQVTQNEALSTELAAEAEIFLAHTSKLAGVLNALKHKAQITARQVDKKIEKDPTLRNLSIESYSIDED